MSFDALTANTLFDLAQTQAGTAKLDADLAKSSAKATSMREAAEKFEAVFVNTMLESMFAGIETDGLFGGGHGEKVYRSMLNEQYANQIAKSGGIGIADQLYAEMIKFQEHYQGEI